LWDESGRGDGTIAAVDIDNTLDVTMQAAFRFRFSEDHLLASFRRYRQQLWWRRPFLGLKWLLAIPFCAGFVFAIYRGIPWLAAIFGAILGSTLLGWPIDAWILRKRFRKSPFHNDEITFTVSADGSHVLGRNSEVRIGWATFTRARRFDDGLMLFQGPGVFNWLPDTAAADGAAVKNAIELARLHVKDFRDV
jgi:hypothetical protein